MACAPGLWPREKTKAAAPESERKVYDALKDGLPAGWYAWHSMKLLDRDGWEGEGDFVIAIPDRGFLVLEVKGGQITKRDGRWYQYGQEMKKDPRAQAHQFAKLLDSRLRAKGFTAPGYGILTIFPDTAFDTAPTQDDVCGTLLGQMDLPYLSEALNSHLDAAFPDNPRRAVGNWINALHELWDEVWTADIKLGTRHELSEEARIQLDATQLAVLNNIGRAPRVLVTGGAGSGKSLLARKRALMAAEKGQRVLVFCFTDALVRHLRQTIDNDLVQVETVGRFSAELLRRAGLAKQIDESSPDFWKNAPFQAAVDALPPEGERPDMVIVDEAQDLEPEWIRPLFNLLRHPDQDPVLLLEDPAQSLYRAAQHQVGQPWRLDLSLRQHPAIRRATCLAFPSCGWEPTSDGTEDVVRFVKSDPKTWRRDLETVLGDLAKESILPRQVMILSPHRAGTLGLKDDQPLGPWPLNTVPDWWEDEKATSVRFGTVHAFKGLESDVVVYLAPAYRHKDRDRLAYTAYSRARHRLIVLEGALAEPLRPKAVEAPVEAALVTPPKKPPVPQIKQFSADQQGRLQEALTAAKRWKPSISEGVTNRIPLPGRN